MVGGVNIAIAIGTTLKIITDWLELPVIPIIVYTNLYSLYKYLIKLSTIKEKCLIINIIVLSYLKVIGKYLVRATKALIINKPIAIFHTKYRKS